MSKIDQATTIEDICKLIENDLKIKITRDLWSLALRYGEEDTITVSYKNGFMEISTDIEVE